LLINDTVWRQYVTWLTRNPYKIIAAILVVTAFFAFQATHIRLNNTRDLWLPSGDRYVETTREIQQIFGGRDIVVIGIEPIAGDIYQTTVLNKIVHLQDRISRIPGAIRGNTASLAAAKIKAINGTEEGMAVQRILDRMPTTPKEIAKLKAQIDSNPFYIGALVSADRKFAAIVADFKLPPEAPGYTDLNNAITATIDSERDSSVHIYAGGAPVAFAGVEVYSNTVAIKYFSAAFAIIMAVQFLAFRSLQGMLLPMVTALLSSLWPLGLLCAAGLQLNSINTTTCILVMAVTSGHATQLLKRYYEEFAQLHTQASENALLNQDNLRSINRAAVIESVTRVGTVTIVAGMIGAITLFSLMLSKIALIRQFGFIAGAGVTSGLIVEMTLMPALRSLLPAPRLIENRQQERSLLSRLLATFAARMTSGQAPWILAGSIALILLIGAGAMRLHGDSSIMHYFSPQDPIRIADQAINNALGGTNTIYFLIEGDKPDSMKNPQVLEAMDKLEGFLEQQANVGKTQSLAGLIKRMNQATHNDDPAAFAIPKDQDLVAQYLFLYSLSGAPGDFDNYVDNDYRRAVVWTFVRSDSTAFAQSLFDRAQPLLNQFPDGITVRIGGTLADSIAVNDVIVHEKLVNTLQMAGVIFVLTSLMLRSFIGGLLILVPVLVIALANFGVMGWFGIPLDMGTAVTASMAISIGADYEIYLLYRFREELARSGNNIELATERSMQTSGKAVLFVALAIAGGYAVLFTSDFTFYSRLATAVCMTMLISAFSALVLLRAMILVFKPRFIFGDNKAIKN
jgi:uncharacterized protein